MMVTPPGRAAVSDMIAMQKNLRTHLAYKDKVSYESLRDIVCLDKRVEAVRQDGEKHSPKFMTLRDVFRKAECPSNGNPVLESLVPRLTGRNAGTCDVSFYNTEERNAIVQNMTEAPAAWAYQYMSTMFTDSTVRKLMEGFTVSAAALATASSFDPNTLLCTSEFAETEDYVAEMAKMWDLEDFGEDEVVKDPLEMTTDARKELLDNLEGKEELDFEGDGDLSRKSGFTGSTGNSTNRSDNTERKYFNHKKRMQDLVTERARNADLDHKNKELLKRLEALGVDNSKHGNPPDSGSSAASDAPQDPHMDLGDSAAEQV